MSQWDSGAMSHTSHATYPSHQPSMRAIPTPHALVNPPSIGHSATSFSPAQNTLPQRANHVYHADGRMTPSAAMAPAPAPSMFGHSEQTKTQSLPRTEQFSARTGTGTPSIFIPGTAITKEDVELMQIRFEATLEEARSDTEDAVRELEQQRMMCSEVMHELETARHREEALLETTMNKDAKVVETEKQVQALTSLLEASEKELVEKHNEIGESRKRSVTLTAQLRDSQADLDTESKEAADMRSRFQTLEAEVLEAKRVLAEQKKQTEELMKANGLYKATHDKFVREGQLSAQLAGAVETLRKESAEMEKRLQQLQAERLNEAKQVLRQQKDIINETVPLLLAVKALSKAREDVSGAVVALQPNTDQWDTCIRNLQQASAAELTDNVDDAPRLKNLAAMLQSAEDASLPNVDVAALKQEIEQMQHASLDERSSMVRNIDTIKEVCKKVQGCLALCVSEVQAACSCHVQQNRKVAVLGTEVEQAKVHNAPLIDQIQKLSEQSAEQQKQLGISRAQLQQEQIQSAELSELAEGYAQSEAELKKKLARSISEIDRMKAFMAKLQITDVPHLHTLLSTSTKGAGGAPPPTPSPAARPSRPPSNPTSAVSHPSSR